MGLLKLGSIYKKKNSKKEKVQPQEMPSLLIPKQKPTISLELNLDLNSPSLALDMTNNVPLKTGNLNQTKNSPPAGSGSLFDDIFAELDTQKDSVETDFSLALALSQQLQLEEDKRAANTTTMTEDKNRKDDIIKCEDDSKPNYLLNSDSIYSSYLRAFSSIGTDTNSSLSTSMFDSLINTESHPKMSEQKPIVSNNENKTPIVTQTVLDSDVSDSDEESKGSSVDNNDDDDHQITLNGAVQPRRMTKGVQPIMDRRPQDSRLLAQRKIDSWTNKLESNLTETEESTLERMKDRHRNQVKMAALRQQQEALNGMLGYSLAVPQAYGPPTLSSNNVVLPHPGILMDPAHHPMFPAIAKNDYSDITQQQQLPPATLVPSAFMPNPNHMALSMSHSKKEHLENDSYVSRQRQSFHPLPPPTKSMSTPVHRHAKSKRSMLPATTTVNSNSSDNQSNVQPSAPSSNATLNAVIYQQPSSYESEYEGSVGVSSSEALNYIESIDRTEDETIAAEADIESSDDDYSSVHLRQRKQMKKSASNRGNLQHQVDEFIIDPKNDRPKMRSFRSAPNLKKIKQSSSNKKMNNTKGKASNSSRASSRRNSQDYSTATTMKSVSPSDTLLTPPLPAVNIYHQVPQLQAEETHDYLQQYDSPQQRQSYRQQQKQQQLRPMKSEPNFPKRNNHYPQQMQQNYEWERLQNYQREQQSRQQHQDKFNDYHQRTSFMPVYAPVYYPATMQASALSYSTVGSSINSNSHVANSNTKAKAFPEPLYNRSSTITGYHSTMMYQPSSFR
ncbi:MAG: hypothetical protein EXX96DRAFT_314167 [Benjaminiella poitrasii]|nr:MAG: hypothetical protein EXX96DRAFT_314167 [Benjaminiella poitrasii]